VKSLKGAQVKQLWIAIVILAIGLSACGEQSQSPNDKDTATTKNTTDAKQTSQSRQQQWIEGWRETSPLSGPRAGAATVVHNDVIYVIGGVDGRIFVPITEFAKINPDGSLGSWRQGPALNEERGFIEAAIHDDYIYVVGGGNGPNGKNLLRSVERAKIQADGSLGPWQTETNAMITPRRCSKVFISGDHIYSLGGFAGALLDTVERAEILEDGSLGEWRIEEQTMTIPRYVNSAKLASDVAYVIGGHDQTKGVGITDVEWAKPQTRGGVENWRKTTAMQQGRYGLTSAYNGGFVYALGGLSGLEYLDSIEYAAIQESGELSAWQYTTAMSEPRATFSTVVYKDRIYLIGGTNQDRYLASVEYAEFNDSGEIGFWGSEQERTAYQEKVAARKQTKTQLPNQGTVTHIQHASMYTYLHVNSNLGPIWLAGPRIEVNVNDKVQFSKGVSMSNFYSKELQQQFPMILFVSKVERID
jgi:hypothetical protein